MPATDGGGDGRAGASPRARSRLDLFSVAAAAREHHVRRLLFTHIGRPVLRAIDRGEKLPFGEFARDGQVFRVLDG
jgi:hypothetical protein